MKQKHESTPNQDEANWLLFSMHTIAGIKGYLNAFPIFDAKAAAEATVLNSSEDEDENKDFVQKEYSSTLLGCSSTLLWTGKKGYNTPVTVFSDQSIGFVLHSNNVEVPQADIVACNSYRKLREESLKNARVVKNYGLIKTYKSKYPNKAGYIRMLGGEGLKMFTTNLARHEPFLETQTSIYHPTGSGDIFAKNIWRKYHKPAKPGKRSAIFVPRNSNKMKLNEAIVFQKEQVNPIDGLFITQTPSPEIAKELLDILKTNPSLKLYFYDETADEYMVRFLSNSQAQSYFKGNLDFKAMFEKASPFKGFSLDKKVVKNEDELIEKQVKAEVSRYDDTSASFDILPAAPTCLIKGVKQNYTYNPKLPLVNQKGDFLRAGTNQELVRIIDTSEPVLNRGKTNAPNIPTFLYFEPEIVAASMPPIDLAEGTNKYYCCMCSHPDHMDENGIRSGNFPNTLKALSYNTRTHLNILLEELKNKNHPLPFIVVHQIAMNDNHVGTVAVRINNLEDSSKNEIMVINSLSGYSGWEDAAVEGLTISLKNCDDIIDPKVPKIYKITPETSGISQVGAGMQSSCALITAAMSCYLTPDLSFEKQLPLLKAHMKTLTGKENEAALRRDYQKVLALPHPSDPQFDLKKAKEVMTHCERHKSTMPIARQMEINTPEDFVRSIHVDPQILPVLKKELHDKGISLFSICSKVKEPSVVKMMFMLESLVFEIEKEGQGNNKKLIEIHKDIYETMWPDYTSSQKPSTRASTHRPYKVNNTYDYKTYTNTGGRFHLFKAAVPDSDNAAVNKKFHGLRGDHLKTKILEDFQERIESVKEVKDLEPLKQQLKTTPEYKILSTGQGWFTRVFGIPTSSMRAFEDMFEQQKANIENAGSTQNKI